MSDSDLYVPEWDKLSRSQKKSKMDAILAKLSMPFTYSDIRTYSLNDIATETVVLNYEGRPFVFVPGRKQVTLGWNNGIDGLEESVLNEIESGFESVLDPLNWWKKQLETVNEEDDEYAAYVRDQVAQLDQFPPEEADEDTKQFFSIPGIVNYINENTSPVRIVDIAPMIAECDFNEVGLVHLGSVNRETNEHDLSPDHFEMVKKYMFSFSTESDEYQYSGACRFVRSDKGRLIYDIYVYNKMSHEELIATIRQQGFSLPTEDQWEYLCGGGCRTLFPFGNRFDEHNRYAYMSEDGQNVLEKPNRFGLHIAYDQYKYETVDSDCLVKGGDGGAALCGGAPFIYIMLPLSAYWRATPAYVFQEEKNLSGGFHFYRRILTIE